MSHPLNGSTMGTHTASHPITPYLDPSQVLQPHIHFAFAYIFSPNLKIAGHPSPLDLFADVLDVLVVLLAVTTAYTRVNCHDDVSSWEGIYGLGLCM